MSENISERPVTISILAFLLVTFGIYGFIRGILHAVQSQLAPELWPLVVATLIFNTFVFAVVTATATGIMKQRRWAWWLAGIYLCNVILGSILSFLQLFFMRINEERLYQIKPEILFETTMVFTIAVCLFPFLYNRAVREYLFTFYISKTKSLAIIFGFAFLVLLLFQALTILASYFIFLNN